jgi:hypothetical protein
MKAGLFAVLGFLLASPALAQEPAATEEPGIQDNSFLLEEAYNQEAGVVQHISFFQRSFDGGAWIYAFTQEWPLKGLRHQLSFTLPVQSTGSEETTGLGDAAINYRFQVMGDGEAKVAVAPRLSLLLPSGSSENGRGAGGVGIQLGLPISWAVSDRLVLHTNAGLTHTPSAKNALGRSAATNGVSLGQSAIVTVSPRFNLMLEAVWSRSQSVTAEQQTEWGESTYLSPGIRWAHNLSNGLQIVPGLAVPIGIGPSKGDQALLLYLSFEHSFKRR